MLCRKRLTFAYFYIIFLQDIVSCTQCMWANENKDEALSKLKQYLVMIKQQYGYTPKQIRINQGGEYLTNEFCTWCADCGIIIEATAPYSPSQNGIAKWINWTLTELAQAMLVAYNLPKSLWPETVNHGAYICNHSYTWALPEKTPEGAWTKKHPNVVHLQEFGVPVWILWEQLNISKLEPKSEKQIFVGFEDRP